MVVKKQDGYTVDKVRKRMAHLENLKGVHANRKIICLFIKNAKEVEVIIRNCLAATAAGNNGAINIWQDDDWNIRCIAYKYQREVDEQCYTELIDAISWTKEWLKKIK